MTHCLPGGPRFWGLLFLVLALPAQAQQARPKRVLDYDSYARWNTTVRRDAAVSPNGKYLVYGYGEFGRDTLVVESTDGKFKQEFAGAARALFSADDRRAMVQVADSLVVIDLITRRRTTVPNGVVSQSGRWVAAPRDTTLALIDLSTGQERGYGVSGEAIFVPTETAVVVVAADSVVWIDLATGRAKTVHRGPRASELAFDSTGTRLAFITGDSTDKVVRVYQVGMDSARVQVTAKSSGMRAGATVVGETPWFSPDGAQLFFRTLERPPALPRDTLLITKTVDVWHFRDRLLQSQQLAEVVRPDPMRNAAYAAVVATGGGPVIPLETRDTILNGMPGTRYTVMKDVVNPFEVYWSATHPLGQGFVLVSLRDGRRTPLAPFQGFLEAVLSPDEQFVVGFDPRRLQYISYEVATGVTRVITQSIPVPVKRTSDEGLMPDILLGGHGVARWVVGDRAVWIYDRYDIWEVDPRGVRRPVNVTAGYGRAHGVTLRIEDTGDRNEPMRRGDVIVLKAYNPTTKDQGYASLRMGRQALVVGRMGPWHLGASIFGGYLAPPPVKAANGRAWLVVRQTERDAPNWFVTTDFTSYRQLTNLRPQDGYNWLTAELVTWTLPDGTTSQGILYKPENFDPTKKYPVILEYYSQRSSELHLYRKPALSAGRLNIPWYVSNGYLVFVPDIATYVIGHPAKSIVDAVVSAADHLATFPWVDGTKMGIQGHSFGGYETMVLVALSHRFAAANAAAGISDLTSKYGTPAYGEKDNTWQLERQIFRMGTTPWERPDLYVENSPILHADSVTTPLLLMHNTGDDNVRIGQSIEMFIALRRLQKPVWLLQYDGEDHGVRGSASRDYTIRQQQFFDYYLKGAPAPVWMTQGVPAAAKGVRSGLEFDTTGRKP